MITSPHNDTLKLIRKLRRKRERERSGLFVAEGEDLVAAAEAAGWGPELLLRAGVDVEPELLDAVSELGSGTRVLAAYRIRWAEPGGALSAYLHAVSDPGNVGAAIRAAHAFCDGPVVLGPGCADPWSPKAVRASMGSLFARPPARRPFEELEGMRVALVAREGEPLAALEARPPVVVCLGAEREGLPAELVAACEAVGHIPMRDDAPDSLGVASATAVALSGLAHRMAADV